MIASALLVVCGTRCSIHRDRSEWRVRNQASHQVTELGPDQVAVTLDGQCQALDPVNRGNGAWSGIPRCRLVVPGLDGLDGAGQRLAQDPLADGPEHDREQPSLEVLALAD